MLSEIKLKLNKIDIELRKCEIMTFHDLVPWSEVMAWKVGEIKNISGSRNELIYREENIFIFETIIPPKVVFSYHWHDFNEHNFIVTGLYKDDNSTKESGEWVGYPPFIPHEVLNPSETEHLKTIVIFTKEKAKK